MAFDTDPNISSIEVYNNDWYRDVRSVSRSEVAEIRSFVRTLKRIKQKEIEIGERNSISIQSDLEKRFPHAKPDLNLIWSYVEYPLFSKKENVTAPVADILRVPELKKYFELSHLATNLEVGSQEYKDWETGKNNFLATQARGWEVFNNHSDESGHVIIAKNFDLVTASGAIESVRITCSISETELAKLNQQV